MPKLEDKIQADIVDYLTSVGIYCHSCPNEGAGGNAVRTGQLITMGLRSGVADLIAWMPSGIAYIEVKQPGGKQSPKQIKFQERCKAHNIPYYLVFSVDDVRKIVDTFHLHGKVE